MTSRSKNSNGSILIEVLLTIVILSVSLVVIIQSFSSALRASTFSSDYSTAILLLENRLFDLLIEEDLKDIQITTETFGQPFDDFSYSIGFNDVDLPNVSDNAFSGTDTFNDFKSIELSVLWSAGSKNRSVSLNTYLLEMP